VVGVGGATAAGAAEKKFIKVAGVLQKNPSCGAAAAAGAGTVLVSFASS
jgi:hypothetical protein